jgi:hypothetical protein
MAEAWHVMENKNKNVSYLFVSFIRLVMLSGQSLCKEGAVAKDHIPRPEPFYLLLRTG